LWFTNHSKNEAPQNELAYKKRKRSPGNSMAATRDKFLRNLFFVFVLFFTVRDGSIVDQRQRVPRLSSSAIAG
jgi:hypothetical protein